MYRHPVKEKRHPHLLAGIFPDAPFLFEMSNLVNTVSPSLGNWDSQWDGNPFHRLHFQLCSIGKHTKNVSSEEYEKGEDLIEVQKVT